MNNVTITENNRPLNIDILKFIAIIAMTIDHIAWAFVDKTSVAGMVMHSIGRITFPVMAFCLVEGYLHTSNIKKYLTRLFVFAVISAFAVNYNHYGTFFKFASSNVIFTLFLGLLCIYILDNKNYSKGLKILLSIVLFLLSGFGDWPFIGIIIIINFYKSNNKFSNVAIILIIFSIVSFLFGLKYKEYFQFGLVLALPFIYLYNGKKGSYNPISKWFFYIYYPLHLLCLGFIKFKF